MTPRFYSFFSDDINYQWIDGVAVERFSGIFQDPNYYSIPLILSIILVLYYLFFCKESKKTMLVVILIVLSSFGFLTMSKSFIIIYLLVILSFSLSSDFKKNIVFVFSIGIFAIAFLQIIPNEYVDNVIYRFSNEEITTGRTTIWSNYLQFFRQNAHRVFLGIGLCAEPLNGRAIHNMYIETIYEIGILGMILYFITIVFSFVGSFKPRKLKYINFIGFICMGLMYFFLEGLTEFEFPFYLMISFVIFRTDFQTKDSLGCNNGRTEL